MVLLPFVFRFSFDGICFISCHFFKKEDVGQLNKFDFVKAVEMLV